MARNFVIKCPCCQVEIDIDAHTGQIVRTGPKAGEPEGVARFDAALEHVKSRGKDALSAFDRATRAVKDRESKLDSVFRDAVKKVKETDDGSRPENPFDMD